MKIRMFFFILLLLNFYLGGEVVLKSNLYEPDSLDPMSCCGTLSLTYVHNIFDTLLRYDVNNKKLLPSLAINWEVRKDGRQYVFKLRKGVKFHDGTLFNADAVIANFRRGLRRTEGKFDFPFFHFLFGYVNGIEKIGDYKVVFNLKKPFYPFLYALTSDVASIISPTALRKYGKKIGEKPVGTGPFVLKEWKKGDKIVLVSNRDYWQGKARVERIVNSFRWRIAGGKIDDLFLLLRGDIDFNKRFSFSKFLDFKNIPWIKVQKVPVWGIFFLRFNMSREPLNNVYFRRALNYLWNRNFLRVEFQDNVIPINSLLPRSMPGYNENSIFRYDFSPIKARKMLKKANVKEKVKLRYITMETQRSAFYNIMMRYKLSLMKVGIELEIKSVSLRKYNRMIKNGQYDLILSGLVASYPETYGYFSFLFARNKMICKRMVIPEYPGIRKIRLLLARAESEKDYKKRIELYSKINSIATKDAITIPLTQIVDFLLTRKGISGVVETPLRVISFYSVKKDEN